MILKNKNIFITGAGKGIGFSSTLEAIKQGAFVYALVKSKKDKKKFKNIKNIKLFFGNVNNLKLIKKILKKSIKDKRKISGIVNNAGIRQRLDFNKISNSKIKNIFEINFFSIFFIMQIFSKYFKEKKIPASIVNVGSIVGNLGFKQLSGYASTKSAIDGLTKSFANEMSDYKIRANVVSPGFTKTSYFKKFKKKNSLYKWTLSRIPLKRWAEPEEISSLICFLLSDQSSYITGENIKIDGGWSNA
tara:strand:+ start:32416 stop:33153 length:738 start_codon:yes stop_codon:yes gene_type:complete